VTKTLISTVFAVIALSACSSGANVVRKDQTGGLVALRGGYGLAMSEARQLMAEHCGGRFQTHEVGDQVMFQCSYTQGAAPATLAAK
jgi:hypothetical protein